MPIDIAELDAAAKVVAVIVGLITILSPFINRLLRIPELQMGYSGVFNICGEIATLAAFLSVLYYRNSLHFLAPFWLWLILAVLVILLLFWIARKAGGNLSLRRIVAGASLYALANGLLILGMTQFAAQAAIFWKVSGQIEGSGNVRDLPVFLLGSSVGELMQTKTNRRGQFQFLLTFEEAKRATEVRAKENARLNENWAVVEWDLSTREYNVALKL